LDNSFIARWLGYVDNDSGNPALYAATAGNTGTAGGFYNTKGSLDRTFRNQFGLGFGSDVFMRSFEDDKILPMYLYTRGSYIKNEYGTFLKQKEVYGNPTVPGR
jgi:hypothetical protein